MSSFGTVGLKEVWAMLDVCAPGYSKKETPHKWRITFNGKTYPSLPLGPHGNRKNPSIQMGHVKNMARHLGILDCVLGQLESMR